MTLPVPAYAALPVIAQVGDTVVKYLVHRDQRIVIERQQQLQARAQELDHQLSLAAMEHQTSRAQLQLEHSLVMAALALIEHTTALQYESLNKGFDAMMDVQRSLLHHHLEEDRELKQMPTPVSAEQASALNRRRAENKIALLSINATMARTLEGRHSMLRFLARPASLPSMTLRRR